VRAARYLDSHGFVTMDPRSIAAMWRESLGGLAKPSDKERP